MANVLKKKFIQSMRKNNGPTGGYNSVTLKNGRTYLTKRSTLGQYITVKGKRRYIHMGETY